ncbi:MAG: hypothetical protein KDJ76_03275 [Xanthobacteraceae bacterium]|nr:hypothetical protein [Xanthobacteraceae bacterium]
MYDPESPLFPYARVLARRKEDRLHAVALFGAFILIAAVLFGTLSFRPF